MYKNEKIVALIPARGGSKSIPYKNIKEIAGKPLIWWVCTAAKNSKYIDEIYVSTEDNKIKKVVESFNLGIKRINRPKKLATDRAITDSVILHFAKKIDFDILVTLQATSPLTTDDDIDRAIKEFINNKNDSMLTGTLLKRFFWTKDGKPLNYNYLKRPMRQDFQGVIMENGAFYITKRDILKKYKNRLGGKIAVFIMPNDTSLEIDEIENWKAVEELLKRQKGYGFKKWSSF